MDIVIGSVPTIGKQEKKRSPGEEMFIEAQVLNVRHPRKPYGLPPENVQDRRQKIATPDPARGKIMTILIPEAYSIPQDAASGKYRILLRFVHKRQGI
ncbi:MAG: hypothetical protein ACOZF0_14030 [Thermodesulfobacteriota bacterium]